MQQQFKVWNSDRTNRLCVIAANLNSLKQKAAEKLGYTIPVSQLRLLLENDGTLIDSDETLTRFATSDLIFLLLKPNEKWIPPAVGVLKNTMCTIPEIITDALKKLELMDKPPLSWKLIDNKGNITVVLHWDHRNKQSSKTRRAIASTTTSNLFIEKCGGYSSNNSSRPNSGLGQWPYDIINTGFNKNHSSKKTDNFYKLPILNSSQNKNKTNGLNVPQLGTVNATSLPELLTAFDEDDEDISEEIINSTLIKELISPSQEFAKCDFHCASLHWTNLKKPNIVRSTATSPIPDFRNTPPPIISVTNEDNNRPISPASSLIKKPKDVQKQHVRFLDDPKNLDKDENNNKRFKQPSIPEADEEQISNSQEDKIKTEVKKEKKLPKNEEIQEEVLHERYLLLVDQVSEDNGSPLSIKDIGTILDKMGSKIVDVEKLEKEKENNKAHNWLIKATVKGEFIREMGVVYKGHYYGIVEHPGYF